MVRSQKAWFAAVALAGVSALALAGCAGGGAAPATTAAGDYTAQDCAADTTSADTLKVGTLLPVTGTLAFLGPPEIAGVGLAVDDIVAAGDSACTFWTDSGDYWMVDGEMYCDSDCVTSAGYENCTDCGEWVDDSEIVVTHPYGEYMCQHCAPTCDECSETLDSDGDCPHCEKCDECGTTYDPDCEDECPDCAEENDDES